MQCSGMFSLNESVQIGLTSRQLGYLTGLSLLFKVAKILFCEEIENPTP